MQYIGPRIALVAAAAALLVAVLAPAAGADSLVYIKGDNVWISHGDGSNPRQVTSGPNSWAWPSEDDAGHIFVAGGQENVSAGMEQSSGSLVYELDQHGKSLIAPAKTPGAFTTVNCPTYPPQGLRVAPDGRHFAYYAFFCDHNVVFLGTTGGNAFTSDDNINDRVFPAWVNNSEYLVSAGGDPGFTGCDPNNGQNDCEWGARTIGQPVDNWYPWFSDTHTPATGFDGEAISRDGKKFATIEDDAADWGGAAHNVLLRLFSTPDGPPVPGPDPTPGATLACQFALPADPDASLWFYNAEPSFSPDGTKLAFAEPDGIHIADVSNMTCDSAPLVIKDATQVAWGPANEAANAGAKKGALIRSLGITPRRFTASQQTTINYVLSKAARVTFVVKRGSRKQETFVRSGKSGNNGLYFFARTAGNRNFAPGTYTLVATAVAGRSHSAKKTSFTIVKG